MSNDESAHLLFLSIEFSIPVAHSLKDKRRVVKRIIERLKNRYNASVIEMGFQEKWQHSIIGLSIISIDKRYLKKTIDEIELQLQESVDIQIIQISPQWL